MENGQKSNLSLRIPATPQKKLKETHRTYQKTLDQMQRLKELLAAHETFTHAQLAQAMGVSVKKIQRLKRRIEEKTRERDKQLSPVGKDMERQMAILIGVSQNHGRVSKSGALNFFIERVSQVTLQRIITKMCKQGLLKDVGDQIELGEKLLPRLNLNEAEYDYLLGFLNTYASRFPLGPQLERALAKVSIGIAEPSWEIMQKSNVRREDRIQLKGAVSRCTAAINTFAEEILELIKERWLVKLTYRSKKGKGMLKISVRPQGVVYNWLNGGWYLAGLNLETGRLEKYRFDQIQGMARERQSESEPPPLPEEMLASWGVEEGPVYPVKVRFAKDFSVQDKVRLDVAERREARLEECADGSLLLIDQVCGLQEIRRWLRQFGASAEVLEPLKLREMMRDSAKRRLLAYGVLTDKGGGSPDAAN